MSKNAFDLLPGVNATTTTAMAKQAGLDFKVEKRSMYYKDTNGNYIEVPNFDANVRIDKDDCVGVVSKKYGIVQYVDMLDFTGVLVDEGEASYVRGGATGVGEQCFVIMKTGEAFKLHDNDKIECYFYVSTSHDRTLNLTVVPTPYRQANNTILIPTDFKKNTLRFRHTKNIADRIAKAKVSLGKVKDYWKDVPKQFNLLSQVHLNDSNFETYLNGIKGLDGDHTRAENMREEIDTIWKTEPTLQFPSCKRTLLGAYFAVVQYADFKQTVKKSKKRDEVSSRILSSLDGDVANRKAIAFGMALTIQKKLAGVSLNA